MRITIWTLFCISLTFSLSSGFMEPRTLEEAMAGNVPKIVYVGVGSASTTDTYQAYPLFMQQLSAQYPGLCRTINFDDGWKRRKFSEDLLLKRDPTLNTKNFFIISENLDLMTAYQIRQYLSMVLKRGGVVILGKFINYAAALQLPLLYMWLLKANSQYKNRLLFFSTLPSYGKATFYWWDGMPYLLYNDMLATEKVLKFRQPARGEEEVLSMKESLVDKIFPLLFDEDTDKILDAEDRRILLLPEKNDEIISDLAEKQIESPKTALKTTRSFSIDVVKQADGTFSIKNISFSKEGMHPLKDFMAPRSLEDAMAGAVPKIVYVGVGSASTTDTYQAYPLFMQQLSAQYPELCRTINFDATWKEKTFTEDLLLKRDPTLNAKNFFTISENLDLKTSTYGLFLYLGRILKQGGVVILGKFTGYESALELPLLYMWLLKISPKNKNRLLFFSTLNEATLYWWNGMPYSLYDDMLATEKLLRLLNPAREKGELISMKKGLVSGTLPKLFDEDTDKILDAEDRRALLLPEQDDELMSDLADKQIEIPKLALETTRSFSIDVAKQADGTFSIKNISFSKRSKKKSLKTPG